MEKAREGIIESARSIKHALADDSGMIAGTMDMHAQFTTSDGTMELATTNKPDGVGYHAHVAGGIEDLHDHLKEHGKWIVDRPMDYGILGKGTLLGHCIYVSKREIDLICDTNTMVVHNPESNVGNACDCPPTMEIAHADVLTGPGMDGRTHDMTEPYKVVNVLYKYHLYDASAA